MKFTTTTIFAAALATISSAAALPADTAAVAVTALPAKFTLRFTAPTSTSPLKKYEGKITMDSYLGALELGPGSNQQQLTVEFIGKDGSATVPDVEFNATRTLMVNADGYTQLWYNEFFGPPPATTVKGIFGQTNGLLSLDLQNGKGAQSTWKACPNSFFSNLWELQWGTYTAASCLAVDVHVVAV